MGNADKQGDIMLKVVVGILIVGVLVFGTSFFVAPTHPEDESVPPVPTDTKKPEQRPKATEGDGMSLLDYLSDDEKVAQLVSDMETGDIPTECNVLYDQMGANPDITVTQPDDISEIYRLVEQIKIDPDSETMPITDSYHHVYFTLQNGTKVGWSFDGAGIISQGRDVLHVTGDDALWRHVIQMQQERDNESDTDAGTIDIGSGKLSDGSYEIALDDADDAVSSCPKSAKPGDEVVIEIYDMTDVYPVVTVDKGKVDVKQKGMSFVFTMPSHPVIVKVYLSDYGIGGA